MAINTIVFQYKLKNLTTNIIATAAFIFILSASLTASIRHLAHKKKLLDIPNHRSSHNRPTPHGGGFAIIVCFLILFLIAYHYDWINKQACFALTIPGIIIGVIGLADDISLV